MALATKPVMLFPPLTYDVSYTAAAEPDADGWTLQGTDHAAVAAGILTIENCGTDQNYYQRARAAHASSAAVWMRALVKVASASVTAGLRLQSATLGKYVQLQFYGTVGGTKIAATGATTANYTLDLTSDYVDLLVVLTKGGYRIFADGVDLGGAAAGTATGSDEIAYFGKITTGNDNTASLWDTVEYGIGAVNACSLIPTGWYEDEIASVKAQSIASDGTVETIHEHDARFIGFEQRCLTDAQLSTLRGYLTTYCTTGRKFYLARDQDVITTSFTAVKLDGKAWRPRRDPEALQLWSVPWRLRVAG